MTPLYQRLKKWFRENYGHLGYDLSPFYDIDKKKLRGRIRINE
jgi:hypothetical protein